MTAALKPVSKFLIEWCSPAPGEFDRRLNRVARGKGETKDDG